MQQTQDAAVAVGQFYLGGHGGRGEPSNIREVVAMDDGVVLYRPWVYESPDIALPRLPAVLMATSPQAMLAWSVRVVSPREMEEWSGDLAFARRQVRDSEERRRVRLQAWLEDVAMHDELNRRAFSPGDLTGGGSQAILS